MGILPILHPSMWVTSSNVENHKGMTTRAYFSYNYPGSQHRPAVKLGKARFSIATLSITINSSPHNYQFSHSL